MRYLFAAAIMISTGLGAGCAGSQKGKTQDGLLAENKVVCRVTEPTGSHITQVVCYDVKQIEQRREADEKTLRDMQIRSVVTEKEGGN